MELAHYVDRLQDENDELRKLMGLLSSDEPQLRIMIGTYKRLDGESLGAKKVVEGSGENEGKIGDIPEPPKTHHKNAFAPKPNYLRNRLDTTPAPPVFPPQTDNFQKPIKPPKTHHKNAFAPKPNYLRNRLDTIPAPPVFPPQTDNFQKPIKLKSVLGNEFFGKKGEKPSEEKPSEEKPEPKENPKPKPFHCEYCGRDGHLNEFCFRRKREERLARELANKDRYRPSLGVP
jgi:hypothetical protein